MDPTGRVPPPKNNRCLVFKRVGPTLLTHAKCALERSYYVVALRVVGRWVAVDLGLFSFSFLGWVTYGEVVQFSLV